MHSRLPVHPHKRGDSAAVVHGLPARHGSPPQAWGQRSVAQIRNSRNRFTPTSVGTAAPFWRGHGTTAVHPHKRGDSRKHPIVTAVSCGSPPQAWGQPEFVLTGCRCRRFTPTSVGTAPSAYLLMYLACGSPPQAWGQLQDPGYCLRMSTRCRASRSTISRE